MNKWNDEPLRELDGTREIARAFKACFVEEQKKSECLSREIDRLRKEFDGLFRRTIDMLSTALPHHTRGCISSSVATARVCTCGAPEPASFAAVMRVAAERDAAQAEVVRLRARVAKLEARDA